MVNVCLSSLLQACHCPTYYENLTILLASGPPQDREISLQNTQREVLGCAKMSRYDRGKNHKSTRRAFTADVLIKRAHKVYEKYCQSGKKSHIHYAIELASGAIRRATAPPASWSLNLAHYLKSRWEGFERPADLDRAVLTVRRGIAAAHEDCQGKSFLLNTLAALLLSRYTRRQAFPDLGRAIQAAEGALAILPRENWSAKPIRM